LVLSARSVRRDPIGTGPALDRSKLSPEDIKKLQEAEKALAIAKWFERT
jgi:hypothetical protein